MRKSKHILFISINGWIFSILAVFIIAGAVTTYLEPFSPGTIKNWSNNVEISEFLIYVLQSENHYFYQDEREEQPFLFSDFIFKVMTNIQPTDIRTFLGSELPGFAIFDTEIVVAGEGTDFTTLPMESAPPLEALLEEREIAFEKLQEESDEEPAPIAVGEKSVFIYHSHSWESFKPLLKDVTKSNEAVSSNEQVNVVALGKKLANELNERGIGTLHNMTNMTNEIHKNNLTYSDSYNLSRNIVQEAMANNNDLKFLIDIHRDAGDKEITTKNINGKSYARVYFIVGKEHKNYEQNLKVATRLNEKLEAKYPGISRGIFKKGKSEGNGIYNQDLSNRALLVEFGGWENDLTELNNTIEVFAEVFSEYYWQAEMVNG